MLTPKRWLELLAEIRTRCEAQIATGLPPDSSEPEEEEEEQAPDVAMKDAEPEEEAG